MLVYYAEFKTILEIVRPLVYQIYDTLQVKFSLRNF